LIFGDHGQQLFSNFAQQQIYTMPHRFLTSIPQACGIRYTR
jgi:hypothetical protein